MAQGGEVPTGYRTEARPLGDPEFVKRAARMLKEAERPVVLAGRGVRWSGAHEALAELAGAYGAPVFLNSLARGGRPRDDPHVVSGARRFALASCDVLLGLGGDWD